MPYPFLLITPLRSNTYRAMSTVGEQVSEPHSVFTRVVENSSVTDVDNILVYSMLISVQNIVDKRICLRFVFVKVPLSKSIMIQVSRRLICELKLLSIISY